MRSLSLACSVALAALLPQPGYSATLEPGGAYSECSATLSGPIEPGDPERTRQAFSSAGWWQGDSPVYADFTGNRVLCLDSPGGSFAEGRQIAEMVRLAGVGTVVPAGAECLSVCAVIFMAGVVLLDDVSDTSRRMDRTARVGFHAPFIDGDGDETYTARQAADLFRVSNLILADLLRFGAERPAHSWRPTISPRLLSEMLMQGPDRFTEIDTVEAAARWGIGLLGVATSPDLSPRDLTQACLNIEAWTADTEAEPLTAAHLDALQPADFGDGFYHLDTGGLEERGCYIAARERDGRAFIEACTRNDFNGINLGTCPGRGIGFPAYYALPPDTRLTALPSG